MDTNLLALARNAIGGDFSKLAGQFLGESPGNTQSALDSLLPTVLGGIARKGATADGAADIMSQVTRSNLDAGLLDNIGGMFGNGGAGVSSLMKAGTNDLVPALFGGKSGALVSALSSASGLKSSSATNLIAMVTPIVLMLIKKLIGERGLSASSLSSLLAGQGPSLQGALDGRLTGALGFGSPGAFLGSAASAAADTARRTGAAVAGGATAIGSAATAAGGAAAAAGASGLGRIWPWVIGAVILAFLWWAFSPRTPAPVPKALVSAPAAPTAAGFPAKVYFETGSASVGPDSAKLIVAAADVIKKDGLKVAITGYTDKAGDTAKNEELAKSRALAVRDALTAAGVPVGNLDMKTPLFVEIGGTTSDAEARRVEISRM